MSIEEIIEQLEAAQQADAPDWSSVITLNRDLAEAYAGQTKFGKAVACLEAAMEASDKKTQDRQELDRDELLEKAEINFQLALYYDRTNETEKALDAAQKAVAGYQACEAENEYPKAYRRLGAIQIELGEADEGLNNLDIALDWAENNNDNVMRAGIYITLAEALNYFKSPDDSYKYYQMAVDLYESEEQWGDAASTYQSIGRLLHNYGSNIKSMEMYKKAATCYEKADNLDEETGLNYMLLARLLESMGRNDEAVAYYEKAAPRFLKAENHFETANCYIQVAALYQEKKDWVSVAAAYQNALPHAEYAADDMLLGTIHDGIAHAEEEAQKVQRKSSGNRSADNNETGGFLGKIKKIFGG